jgi:hypothetical protein
MRYAAAAYHLLLVDDETAGDARDAEHARSLELARAAAPAPSLRRRAGAALIAFGTRLAGDHPTVPEKRRLAARAS